LKSSKQLEELQKQVDELKKQVENERNVLYESENEILKSHNNKIILKEEILSFIENGKKFDNEFDDVFNNDMEAYKIIFNDDKVNESNLKSLIPEFKENDFSDLEILKNKSDYR
jgi:hypothetical protein